MKFFNDLQTRKKLVSVFVFMSLFLLAVTLTGYLNLRGLNQDLNALNQQGIQSIQQVLEIQNQLQFIRGNAYQYLAVPSQRDQAAKSLDQAFARVNEKISALRNSGLDQSGEDAVQAFEQAFRQYQAQVKNAIETIQGGDTASVVQSFEDGDLYTSQAAADKALTGLVEGIQARSNAIILRGSRTFQLGSRLTLGMGVGLLIFIVLIALVTSWAIVGPLQHAMESAYRLSQGDLLRGEENKEKELLTLVKRRDEIGQILNTFESLIAYMQNMAQAANRIAEGDLTVSVIPLSEKDELGNAFAQMVTGLRIMVSGMSETARQVNQTSSNMAEAIQQTGQATNDIAQSIQQVSGGIVQQEEATRQTAHSMTKISQAMQGLDAGVKQQSEAVINSSQSTAQLGAAIQKVAEDVENVIREAQGVSQNASNGSQAVEETLRSMKSIQTGAELLTKKIHDLGARSSQIGEIVETIDSISSQTNLLALNAAIEAARTNGRTRQITQQLMQAHLMGVAAIVGDFISHNNGKITQEDVERLAHAGQVHTLSITDEDGKIIYSSDRDAIGFRFPEDPRDSGSEFRKLLNRSITELVQPIMPRSADGRPFMYEGIARMDKPGIIETGMPAEAATQYFGLANGFAVVADEVRKLADQAASSTHDIGNLVKTIQKTVNEAVEAVDRDAHEVKTGVDLANRSGAALEKITSSVGEVNRQAKRMSEATQQMRALADQLVKSVATVSSVVENNEVAMGFISENSNSINQEVQNIAGVSQQNSAAVQGVSASAEEVAAQVREMSDSATLMEEMAQRLEDLVGRFQLE